MEAVEGVEVEETEDLGRRWKGLRMLSAIRCCCGCSEYCECAAEVKIWLEPGRVAACTYALLVSVRLSQ